MTKLVIVDYGAGNLASVKTAIERLGIDARISSTPDEVLAADRIILPGVGAAGLALSGLRSRRLDEALHEAVRVRGRPFLGICLGMQVMAKRLYEFGEHEGLGWIDGTVVHLSEVAAPPRVPHMGWVEISPTPVGKGLLQSLRGDRQFYFCHSFALQTP